MAMPPNDATPIVLVPGLLCSARLYAAQIEALWPFGPVTVADHRRDDSMAAIATRILAAAPPRFALAGLSMGGYVALEIVRQEPARVARLALLDSRAAADPPEAAERRRELIALAQAGRFEEVVELHFPSFVHRRRREDPALRQVVRAMAAETGADAYVREQRAILARPDARPRLAQIACPTLVLVGDGDELTPPPLAREMAAAIPRARLVEVPDCGHLSTLEQPRAVNEALRAWLAAD